MERSHSGLVHHLGKVACRKAPGVRISPSPPSPRRSSATADTVRKVASEGGHKHIYMFYVYILKCSNGRLYIGCTNNLKERLERHKNGNVPATKGLLPVKILAYICFPNKYIAYNFERYLKSGSGRAFMKKHLLTKVLL